MICREPSKKRTETTVVEAGKWLGYSGLRENQVRIVQHLLSGKDVFVSLPTGSGKSLCYCVLPYSFDLLHGGSVLQIDSYYSQSSRITHVRHMCKRNVTAVYVGHCMSEADICDGRYQLVFLSPEALLMNETWRDMLMSPIYQENLMALVIDKAHCVKKW